jgi:hypothetical protein
MLLLQSRLLLLLLQSRLLLLLLPSRWQLLLLKLRLLLLGSISRTRSEETMRSCTRSGDLWFRICSN